ncbi:MAG: hypothetical protein ABW298_10555 [Candidatus Binatia bacterium]
MTFDLAGKESGARTIDRVDLDLRKLFALNVLLQLGDGMLTYQALQFGFPEGNPLIKASMATVGSGPALLLFKANACGLLLLLRRSAPPLLGASVLRGVALGVALLAVVPWLGKYLALAASWSP